MKGKKESNISGQNKKILFRNNKFLFFSILILFLFFVLVMFLIFLEMGQLVNPFSNFNKTPKEFNIQDRCSLIAGKLIHIIENEEVCQTMCKTYCDVRKLSYKSAEFVKREKDCHLCKCYCL